MIRIGFLLLLVSLSQASVTTELLAAIRCKAIGDCHNSDSSLVASSVQLGNAVDDFLSGIFTGLQDDPSTPSYCVTQVGTLSTSFSNIASTAITAIETFDLNGPYWTTFAVNNTLNLLAEISEECALRLLTETIAKLLTSEGIANLLTRIALQFRFFNDSWQAVIDDFGAGNYSGAGKNFGELMAIILNFKIQGDLEFLYRKMEQVECLREESFDSEGHLVKRVVKEGTTPIPLDAKIWLFIECYMNNEPFGDQNIKSPLQIVLGTNATAIYRYGWQIVIPSMKLDEVAWVKLGPAYHFGSQESELIDANGETLWQKITIFAFVDQTEKVYENISQRLEHADELVTWGNVLLKKELLAQAKQHYNKAIDQVLTVSKEEYATWPEEDKSKKEEINLRAKLNYLHIQLQQKNYIQAKNMGELLLENNPQCTKLLYRLAKAHFYLHNYDQTVDLVSQATLLTPDDPMIKTLLANAQARQKRVKENTKKNFGKIFNQEVWEAEIEEEENLKCQQELEEMRLSKDRLCVESNLVEKALNGGVEIVLQRDEEVKDGECSYQEVLGIPGSKS